MCIITPSNYILSALATCHRVAAHGEVSELSRFRSRTKKLQVSEFLTSSKCEGLYVQRTEISPGAFRRWNQSAAGALLGW